MAIRRYIQNHGKLDDVFVTVTVGVAAEVCVSGDNELSVTRSSNAYVSPAVSGSAVMEHVTVAPELAPAPLFTTHCVAGT
jgi:hypothetical protein